MFSRTLHPLKSFKNVLTLQPLPSNIPLHHITRYQSTQHPHSPTHANSSPPIPHLCRTGDKSIANQRDYLTSASKTSRQTHKAKSFHLYGGPVAYRVTTPITITFRGFVHRVTVWPPDTALTIFVIACVGVDIGTAMFPVGVFIIHVYEIHIRLIKHKVNSLACDRVHSYVPQYLSEGCVKRKRKIGQYILRVLKKTYTSNVNHYISLR